MVSTRLSVTIALAVFAVLACTLLPVPAARANFSSFDGAFQFAVLSESTVPQTNFNTGTITGDVGIGSPGQFTLSNASLTGSIFFSGASNTTGLTPNPNPGSNPGPFTVSGGGTVTGGVVANSSAVTTALGAINSYSATLAGEAGTAVTITSGGSLTASSGMLDAFGNRVFNVAPLNFPNGAFTINGSASDFVVLNNLGGGNWHGQILLNGITSDHVLINAFGAGNALDVNTNGLTTHGIFLDPTGKMSAVNTNIQGRFWGGDSQNMQIVSGFHITAPASVPEPTSLLLLGVGLAGLAAWRSRHRRTGTK